MDLKRKSCSVNYNILNFFYNSEQSDDTLATGYKGFYYHFLDMKTGKRFRKCELSTIDTGLLFAGIIFARQYYNQDKQTEKEIRDLAGKLLNRAEWEFFVFLIQVNMLL
jgi:hypothetical protein